MTKDINNFLTIVRQKNGLVKIVRSINQEGNLYRLLRELGYRKAKLGSKRIYFKRDGKKVVPVNLRDIKDAFLGLLEKFEFTNIPEDIEYSAIYNWYYQKRPVRVNGLFDHCLEDTLTDIEANDLLLVTDGDYKHRLAVQQLLSKFDEWGFGKTKDEVGAFCKDNPLYYKHIADSKYLVFNHYNSQGNAQDGFDCWIATYKSGKHIGNKKPDDIQDVRLSFQLDRDFQLIEEYIKII